MDEPPAERVSKNNSTPESRVDSSSSTGSNQEKNARAADPNDGRCLVTNLCEAIETCHLVTGATSSDDLRKLEYAWGLDDRYLNLNTRYNLFFLRADWHKLFDDGHWILIPELSALQMLRRVTIDKAPRDRSQIDLEKTFGSAHFSYHFLPLRSLKDPIRRFEDPNNPRKRSTYRYPFTDMGPLVSHVRPQYVVVNTAQKLSRPGEIIKLVIECGRNATYDTYTKRIQLVLDLYDRWTSLSIFDDSIGAASDNRSGDADQLSVQSSDAPSGEDQSNDDEESSDSEASSPSRSKQRRLLQDKDLMPSSTKALEDSIIEDDGWSPSEEAAWTEEICSWVQKCSEAAVSEGGWERGVFNEDQVGAYAKEHPRSVPPPESWHKWRPRWEKRSGRYPPFNTEKFSSNDWASFQEDTYLTWPSRR